MLLRFGILLPGADQFYLLCILFYSFFPQRTPVSNEPWKTYGQCRVEGTKGTIFFGLVVAINFFALLAACYQAYKARHISDEFSESKNLGLALFTWLQLLLLALPSLFLINPENYAARYFVSIGLLFVLTLSMLLVIFVPLILALREYNHEPSEGERNSGGQRNSGRQRNRLGSGAARGRGSAGGATGGGPVYTCPLPNDQANIPMEISHASRDNSRESRVTSVVAVDAEKGLPTSDLE